MAQVYCDKDGCIEELQKLGYEPARIIKIGWLIRCERCNRTMASNTYEMLLKRSERLNKPIVR